MKTILLLIALLPFACFGQNELAEYQLADSLLQANQIEAAYNKFKILETQVSKNDSLYDHTLWYYTNTATHLEAEYRTKEDFKKSLEFGLNALSAIEKGKDRFNEDFAKREYFMVKNIIVAHFGLGNFEEGKNWKERLYQAKKNNKLPKGIDEFFNFDYFTYEDKNIWGYEWYEELPKDRFSKSFTKVVYYVYDTNPDGSDKDQLYRLHVLMFHGNIERFDYVLTKRRETAKDEVSGTLYSYHYKENIDYAKLQMDIKEVLKGNLSPDTKTTIPKSKGKKGKNK